MVLGLDLTPPHQTRNTLVSELWSLIFFFCMYSLVRLIILKGTVTETCEVFIGYKKLISAKRTIINDILLLCSYLRSILVYFECVSKFFQKYCVSFLLDKCDFKKSIKYVGHDVTEDGNCPAQSEFYLINDWKLPTNGQALFSFIGLVDCYHRYYP